LPLDPPLGGAESWNALADSLFGGLCVLPEQCIAIVWPNAYMMAKTAPPEFDIAMSVFVDLAHGLGNPRFTRGEPKNVVVVVEQDPIRQDT
jgi:hypothetical protein